MGAGAGYTISLEKGFDNIKVNSIGQPIPTKIRIYNGYAEVWDVPVDIDAVANIGAYSYRHGGKLDEVPFKITGVRVDPEDIEGQMYDEYELKDVIYSLNKIDFQVGGGWSHSTFNGKCGTTEEVSGDYTILAIEAEVVGMDYINYIDDLVSGAFEYEEDDYDQYNESLLNESNKVESLMDLHNKEKKVQESYNFDSRADVFKTLNE